MTALSQKVHEVAARALRDPDYAAELKQAALAAVKGGAKSEAFRSYFERFASTPGELASLGQEGPGCTCRSTTYMTISSLVTPVPTCCNTTTTTTTSGNYFGG